MKKIKKELQEVEIIEDVICNVCGESCNVIPEDLNISSKEFNGIIEYEVVGGYFGTAIADGDVYKFSVCEKCLVEFMRTFKHDPYQGNVMDHGLTEEEMKEMIFDNSVLDPEDPLEDDEAVELIKPYPTLKKEDLN